MLLPLALAVITSADTVPGDFIFDDAVVIDSNPAVVQFDLRRIFTENYWGTSRHSPNWRPLIILSYALNYRISDKPWAFHVVNVALHGMVTAVFYLLAGEALRSRWAASAAACVFAVLPIHTEAVANVVGRAELLAAGAIFLPMWIALRWEKCGAWPAVSIGLAVLAGMLCKENTIVAVALIPIAVYLLRRRIAWLPTSAALAGVLAYLVLWKTVPAESGKGHVTASIIDNALFSAPWLTRALNAVHLLGLYAFRTVLPIHLAADHSFDQLPVRPAGDPILWLEAVAVVLGLTAAVAFTFRRRPALALGLAFFPLSFAVTANIVFPIGTIFAERLAYVPSAGYALALAAGLAAFAGDRPARRRAGLGALAVVVAAYGARTMTRNAVWSDAATFDVRLAEDSPGSTRAHVKAAEGFVLLSRRAKPLEEKKRLLERAEAEVAEAIRIYPDNPGAHGFRAEVFKESRRWPEALAAIGEAHAAYRRTKFEEDPELSYVEAEVLWNLNRYQEARDALDRYLGRRGPTPKALNMRGACLLKMGDPEGARKDFDAAIAADPRGSEALLNRGILFASQNRMAEAGRDFEAAAAADPRNPQVYANRGFFRFTQSDPAGAVADYRKGIEVCADKGLIAEPGGESVLAFRQRIFDVLLKTGDRDGARREIVAIRALGGPLAEGVARSLEETLKK
jgi:protein O-mannosyl-transferase